MQPKNFNGQLMPWQNCKFINYAWIEYSRKSLLWKWNLLKKRKII